MGDLYLCSRTDILRNLYLDTGRKVAVIGAPDDFLSWIYKILPIDTEIVPDPSSLTGNDIDVILHWTDNDHATRVMIRSLKDHLNDDGDLWLSIPLEKADTIHGELDIGKPMFQDQLRLMLRPDRMLVPVHIGSDRS